MPLEAAYFYPQNSLELYIENKDTINILASWYNYLLSTNIHNFSN